MAKKNRTFKVDGTLVEVSPEEVDVFMQSVPDAIEVEPYVIGKDTIGVALDEVEAFKASMPDAKPLYAEEAAVAEGQKKSPVGTSPEATGGFGESVAASLRPIATAVEAAYPVAKNWVKSLFETEEKKPIAKPAPGEVSISEFDRNAIAKSVADAPEQLRDSQDFKINWVNTYSKKTGVDKRAVMQIYDQANGARKTIDRLEAEYYGPAVPVTPEGVPAPAMEKAPEEDPMQKFGKLYELARMYNFVGDHDRAEQAYFELERGLFDYGNAQMQNEDFRSRAPKNYVEQLQSPATQGLAYTKYLKGDKAGAKKIVNILETKGLLEKEAELPQVGAGELVQPGMPLRKTTYGFAGKRGYKLEGGKWVPESTPTKESQYLSDIANAIEQVSLVGPAAKMPLMGMEKIEKGAGQIYGAKGMYDVLNGTLNTITGVVETAAGVAGISTPAGSVFALPFFQVQNSLPPEVSEWMMPVSKMVRNYYGAKGKEVPEWAENTAVLADFATLALLHQGATKGIKYGKNYNRARIMDDALTDLSPETKNSIFSDIEKNYKATGSDPVVYAEQVKEKLNSVKEEAQGLQADLKATEPTPEYKPEPAPETLGQLKEGDEVEYQGQQGVIERGEDMSWNVNMGDGKVIELPTTDKTNPTEKLVDLGVNILPEVPKEQIAKAMADAEQTGKIQYKGKTYFVSLDRVNNPTPNGDFVVEIMPDGRMVDRFTRHPDPNFAAGRKLAITNAFLESKGLPKRSKNVEPWKEAERIETAEGIITFEPETPNAAGGKGQYVLYDNLGEARVITEQEFNRLKELKVEKAPAVEEAAVTAESIQGKKIEAPVLWHEGYGPRTEGDAVYLESEQAAKEISTESKPYLYFIEKPYEVRTDADFKQIKEWIDEFDRENPGAKWHPDTTKYINDKLREQGYDSLIIHPESLESNYGYENIESTYGGAQTVVFDKSKVVENTPQAIAEAYAKAKADGSNPKLIEAVEKSLQKTSAETVQPKVGDTVTIEPVKEGAEPRKMVFTEDGWKQEVEGRQVKASTVAKEAAMKALAEKPTEAVEPIRELGTGAKVYFETEKYRVNEDLKTGDVLLNIEGREGPGAIANIRFDNPADAVKIAERINKDFPQGVPDALLIDKYVEGLKRELLGKPEVEAKPVVEEVKPIEEPLATVEATAKALEGKDIDGINTSVPKSNKAISDLFQKLVKNLRDELEEALYNWKEVELIIDYDGSTKLKGYIGRDRQFTRGKEGGSYRSSKQEFIEWLFSEQPFDKKVYDITPEWTNLINKLRNKIGYFGDNPKSIAEAYHKAKAEGTNPKLIEAVEGLVNEGKRPAEGVVVEEVKVPTPEEEASLRAKEQERKQKNAVLDMVDKYNGLAKKDRPVTGANLLGKIREQAEAAGYDVTQGKQGKIVLRNKATGNKMIRPAREISPEAKAELEKKKADNKRALSGTPIDFRQALLQVLLRGTTISWDSLGRILGYKSRAEYPKFVGSEKGMAIDQLWEMMRDDPDLTGLIPEDDYDFGNMVADVIGEFTDRGAMWDALKEYGKNKWKEMGFENEAQYEYIMDMQKALGEHGISINELKPSEWETALQMAEMADDATVKEILKELDANFPETQEQINKFYEDHGYEKTTGAVGPEAGRPTGIGEEAPRAAEPPRAEEAPRVEPPPSMGEGLKNALDELKKAQDKFREDRDKLGVAFDPKKQAQSLYDLHQAYLKVAKEAIKEGVRKIEEFAKLVPAMTKGAAMAFEEALGRKAKLSITDFEGGKLPKEYNEPYTIKGKGIKAAIREATEMPIGKEYKDLVVRVKAEVKAAIDGYKAGRKEVKEQWAKTKAQNKEFADKINNIMQGLKGKVDPRTAQRLVKKALNATTPARMRAFESFAEKAIMRANYLDDLGYANDLRTKLKKLIKGKDVKNKLGANNVAIIDQFSKIRPEDLDSFDTYNDIAERLIESNKSMQYDKVTGGVKRAERAISNEEVANFLADHQNKVEEQARADIRAEFQDLVDMGVIDPDTMTADDMISIINSIENTDVPMTDQMLAELFDKQIAEIAARQELTPEMENKRLTLGEKILKAFQDAAKYSQMNLEKYFIEEAPALTERQKQTINSLMEIDTEKLSKDQALLVNRTIQNIISNNSFAGADQVAGVISFNQKAVVEAQKIIGDNPVKELGVASRTLRSKDLMVEKMINSVDNAAKLKQASGIEQLWNKVSKTENRFHDFYDNPKVSDSYLNMRDKLSKRDKVDYNTVRNRAIRGMYAKVIKNFGGTEAEMAAEFVRHKTQVYENIKAYLSAGGDVQFDSLGYIKEDANGRPVFKDTVTPSTRTLKLRQQGELLYGIYNELFKDANNALELQKNVLKDGKGNVELVERAIDINKELENDFFESVEMDQNKIDLDHQNNYTRDKYRSSIDVPLNREETAQQMFDTVFKNRSVKDKATGSMNKVIRNDKSYKGRLLNFDFDNVFRNALHEDMFTTATSKNLNQLKELFRSGDANKVFGNEANARAIKDMLVRAIDIMRNEHAPASESERRIWAGIGGLASDAGRLALSGVFQLPKQFFGAAAAALTTNGPKESPRMLRYFAKGFANMNHPMLNEFNISQRGTIRGGFFEMPSDVITEKGLLEKQMYEKVIDFRKKLNDALGEPLGKGDAGVARSTWWMHYLDYLYKQGVDVDAIDFSTITPDYDAAAYAEQMVSRMQNANDRASMPQLYAGGNPFAKIMRDIVMPFSSFGLNQNRRMANDLQRVISGPKEERRQAYNAFLATATEQMVFNGMKVYLLGNMSQTGASLILDYFDVDDEEKNKYKDAVYAEEKKTLTDKWIWSTIEDFAMAGIPVPIKTATKQTINYSYNAIAGTDVDSKWNQGPFYIYTQTQDPSMPPWFEYLGLYGGLLKEGYDLYDLSDETFFGTTEGYGGVDMPIKPGERRLAQAAFLVGAAGLIGVSDQEVTSLNNKVKKGLRKHLLGEYGGEIQITVGKKPTTSASFLRAKQDPKERAEVFIKVWKSPKLTDKDKKALIKQGVEDKRTFTGKFNIELKKADWDIYNEYLILKREAQLED